jgi:two-component system NtrC family sensor kinase
MPKQNEKILVADPDPEVLDLVAQQVLGPQGYQVATASDGSTALKLALRMSPDIIITSLDLPGLSGRDLMTALRSQGFESVVIATGSKGSELAAMQAFRLGAKDFLTKPLREAELIAALDRALEELRLRRER